MKARIWMVMLALALEAFAGVVSANGGPPTPSKDIEVGDTGTTEFGIVGCSSEENARLMSSHNISVSDMQRLAREIQDNNGDCVQTEGPTKYEVISVDDDLPDSVTRCQSVRRVRVALEDGKQIYIESDDIVPMTQDQIDYGIQCRK